MKITLTTEQISEIIAVEEKKLRVKYDKDLAAIKKKYEVVEIDISSVKQGKRTKLSDEVFNQYLGKGYSVKKIAELTGYNEGYIYRIKKRITENKK